MDLWNILHCRALSEEQKAEEILSLLPLITPFADNFNNLKDAITTAMERLTELEEKHHNIK